MSKKTVGVLGERKSVDYLKSKKYKILITNYRCKYGEIDIIAQKDSILIFIEVKTRNSLSFGRGMETVNYKKQQRIRKTALYFLQETKIPFKGLRFDVIDILNQGTKSSDIIHIKNAF